ncbi:hypothetical protein Q5O12_28370, partial [Klebsiella pneumoniae]|uniref:hypothetical protein n=1 Tax=Klebsiella pneumoniae TaxID=573 RepID=UPI00272F22BA
MLNSNRSQVANQLVRLLIVTHADGYLELFCESPVQAFHASIPHTLPQNELKAELAMELGLP